MSSVWLRLDGCAFQRELFKSLWFHTIASTRHVFYTLMIVSNRYIESLLAFTEADESCLC